MRKLIDLEMEIDNANFRIKLATNAVAFWRDKEDQLRIEYKDSTESWDFNHIAKTKKHRKEAEANLTMWQNELERLQNKLNIYKVMM